jgi:hypothetical protein
LVFRQPVAANQQRESWMRVGRTLVVMIGAGVLALVGLGAGGAALPSQAVAKGGVDRSFGHDGLVLPQLSTAFTDEYVEKASVAPGGKVYLLGGAKACSGACLTRLRVDGSSDLSWGNGTGFVA